MRHYSDHFTCIITKSHVSKRWHCCSHFADKGRDALECVFSEGSGWCSDPNACAFYHLSFGYNGQRLCIKLRVWGVQGQQTVNSPFRECMEAASRLSGRCRGRYRVRANVLQPTMHVPASSVDPDFIRPQMFCHKTCLMMHSDVLQAPETFKRSILLLVEDFDCGKSLFLMPSWSNFEALAIDKSVPSLEQLIKSRP